MNDPNLPEGVTQKEIDAMVISEDDRDPYDEMMERACARWPEDC